MEMITDYAGYGAFKTSDRDLVIGAFTIKQTQNLFKALNLENISHEVALMSKKQLKKNKKKFKKIISKVVICKTADYWEEILNKHHVQHPKCAPYQKHWTVNKLNQEHYYRIHF